jgi:hypothetical protein
MGTGNGAQILEVLSGSDLHAQGIAIWLFFERARLFAYRVSAFACFPCHCYLQPNLLILLPYFRNVITLQSRWQGAVWRTDLVAGGPGDLEAGIKIADDVITAAREEIALEVGGVAKLDEAAKPFEKLSSAAWLKQ